MLFDAYPEENLNGIGHVGQDIEQVKRYTAGLLTRFSELFNSTEGRFGATFSTPEGSYFQIQGHFGLVKAGLLFANEGAGTFGRVLLRKHTLDEQGREAWPEIWAFRISKDGDVSAGDYGPTLYSVWNTPDEHKYLAIRRLAESIVLSAMKPR